MDPPAHESLDGKRVLLVGYGRSASRSAEACAVRRRRQPGVEDTAPGVSGLPKPPSSLPRRTSRWSASLAPGDPRADQRAHLAAPPDDAGGQCRARTCRRCGIPYRRASLRSAARRPDVTSLSRCLRAGRSDAAERADHAAHRRRYHLVRGERPCLRGRTGRQAPGRRDAAKCRQAGIRMRSDNQTHTCPHPPATGDADSGPN